ncbi:uncharacterized protein ACNLHF_008077 [Anomaloglossus baeobatrachus]
MCKQPILVAPDFVKEFVVHTDASEVGLGKVLSQEINVEEHFILYLRKKLSACDKNYTIVEKEHLAIKNSDTFTLMPKQRDSRAHPACGTCWTAVDAVGDILRGPGDMAFLRIGAATEAARAGLPNEVIQRAAKPVIWLLGHSYIFWAGQRAENRPGGRALGFRGFEVNWRGIRGLIWPQVLPEVVGIARSALSPVVLVIHAGGNDLGSRRLAELITTMRSDLDKLHAFFPELVIVWSEVVSRVVWRRAQGAAALERSRRTLNSRISRFVRFKAGIVVRHRQLEGDNSPLMITDGVHLNEIGLDIFLSGLQDGIEQALCLMGGGRSAA